MISTFAYVIAPDSSQYANQMHLSIHSKPPGFETLMLVEPNQYKKRQSFFDRFFFGDKYPDNETPISSYQIKGNKIFYEIYNNSFNSEEFFNILPLVSVIKYLRLLFLGLKFLQIL